MEKINLIKKELKTYKTVDVYVSNGNIVCSDVPIEGYSLITTSDNFPVTTEDNLLQEGEFIIDGDSYITIVSGAVESLTEEKFNQIHGTN